MRIVFAALLAWASLAAAAEIPLTIVHTNDLHSHFKPAKGPVGLGGMTRIATTFERIRDREKNTIFLDGGDFTEGHIYYNLGAGRASMQMMNLLGYDAVVVGNHDWYNGMGVLGDVLAAAPPRFEFLGANLKIPASLLEAKPALNKIHPYVFIQRGGLKIGVIGIVNFERIYDKLAAPAKPDEGFVFVREHAKYLKESLKADLVIVLSHNNIAFNQAMAGMKYVDILIHSHDHERYSRPIGVERNGKLALMVEAGSWGHFVGKLDLMVDPENKTWRLKDYDLIQMDHTIPSHPAAQTLLNGFDGELERKYGNLFNDDIIDLDMDLRREGDLGESALTNVMADAYRAYTGADASFECPKFTSEELYGGKLSTVDLMNAAAFIYNPLLGKSWTLKVGEMSGSALEEILSYMALGMAQAEMRGASVSGIRVTYDASIHPPKPAANGSNAAGPLVSLEIGGKPINRNALYRVALPQGILDTLYFVFNDPEVKKRFAIHNLKDTNVEEWEILSWYLKRNAPLNPSTFNRSGRFIPLQPDVALYYEDLQLRRHGSLVNAKVVARNVGLAAAGPRRLSVGYEGTPDNYADDPNPRFLPSVFSVPALSVGEAATLDLRFELPPALARKNVTLYFSLDAVKDDAVRSNDQAWMMSLAARSASQR